MQKQNQAMLEKKVFLGRIVGKVIAFDPLNLFAPLGGKGCWVNKVVDPARSVHEEECIQGRKKKKQTAKLVLIAPLCPFISLGKEGAQDT